MFRSRSTQSYYDDMNALLDPFKPGMVVTLIGHTLPMIVRHVNIETDNDSWAAAEYGVHVDWLDLNGRHDTAIFKPYQLKIATTN